MPSLSGKIEMLMESYEQSKRTPAYRELRSKYKALKKHHKEIMLALAQGISLTLNNADVDEAVPKKKHRSRESKQARKCANLDELDPRNDLRNDPKEEEHTHSDIRMEVATQAYLPTSQEIIPEPTPIVIKVEPNLVGNYTEREAEIEAGVDLDLDEEEVVIEMEEEEVIEDEEEVVIEMEEEEVIEEEEEVVEEEVIEEEEEVVEEEVVEEEVVEEEVVEEEVVEEEEEEAGVYEIEINGTRYYTTSEQDGIVYKIDGEDDVGDEIGKFVNGKFKLNK